MYNLSKTCPFLGIHRLSGQPFCKKPSVHINSDCSRSVCSYDLIFKNGCIQPRFIQLEIPFDYEEKK